MRYRMSSKLGEIRPWTAELAALEHLKKNPHRFTMRKMSKFQHLHFWLDSFIAGNNDSYNIADDFKISEKFDHGSAHERLKNGFLVLSTL